MIRPSIKRILIITTIGSILMLAFFFTFICRQSLHSAKQEINNADFSRVEYSYCTNVIESYLYFKDLDWAGVEGERMDKAVALLSEGPLVVEFVNCQNLHLLFDEFARRGVKAKFPSIYLSGGQSAWTPTEGDERVVAFHSDNISINIEEPEAALNAARMMAAYGEGTPRIDITSYETWPDDAKAAAKVFEAKYH